MFGKLLKYDLKSVFRIWWILAISVLGMSVMGACALRGAILLERVETFSILFVLCILVTVAGAFSIIASFVVTGILVYLRFYRHFFSDEGYLTFTLPVSRRSLLLSKTVNALIWHLAQILLLVLCLLLFVLIGIPNVDGKMLIRLLGNAFTFLWAQVGGWLFVYVLEGLFLIVCSMLFSISLIHFSITMGAMLAKKLKLLAAIGVYYVVNMVVSLGSQIALLFFTPILSNQLAIILSDAGPNMQKAVLAVILLIVGAMMAAFACMMYLFMQTKLERNLNLA